MGSMQRKSLDMPDETRTLPNGRTDIWNVGDFVVGRITFQPGWRWSKDVKPIAGTEWCEYHHLGLMMEGTLHYITPEGLVGRHLQLTPHPGRPHLPMALVQPRVQRRDCVALPMGLVGTSKKGIPRPGRCPRARFRRRSTNRIGNDGESRARKSPGWWAGAFGR
jgi:hypothetical protein